MFYCQLCAVAAKWPTDFWLSQSYGPCELCRSTAPCFDVRSSNLPMPDKGLDDRLNRMKADSGHEIEEEP